MPTTTQLVISGLSRPGVLAQVAQVLGEAKVNIKAFSAPEVTGTGKLRLLVADLEGARAALKAAKIKFTEETALLLSLERTEYNVEVLPLPVGPVTNMIP